MILSFPLKSDIFANQDIVELAYILSSLWNCFGMMSRLKNLIKLCVMIQSISRGLVSILENYHLKTIII